MTAEENTEDDRQSHCNGGCYRQMAAANNAAAKAHQQIGKRTVYWKHGACAISMKGVDAR
jgi:hypothetical protein